MRQNCIFWHYSLWHSGLASLWTCDFIELCCSNLWKWLFRLSFYLCRNITSLYANEQNALVDIFFSKYLSFYMFLTSYFFCLVLITLNHQLHLTKKIQINKPKRWSVKMLWTITNRMTPVYLFPSFKDCKYKAVDLW